jgi:putative transposase
MIGRNDIKHRTRYKLKRLQMKARVRIRNLIDDCHRKAIQWLCSNYLVILLPSMKHRTREKRGRGGLGRRQQDPYILGATTDSNKD